MTKAQYKIFEALNPFFGVVMEGIRGLVDGIHYFDTFAEDAIANLAHFTSWSSMIRGRANLIASFSGYGKTIKLHSGDLVARQHAAAFWAHIQVRCCFPQVHPAFRRY